MSEKSPSVVGSGLPRSYQRYCLLMLLNEGPCHGYDLLEQVHELGLISADTPGLYRSLRSMEEDGLVVSSWEKSQIGPPRRSYQISDIGKRALAEALENLVEVHSLLTRMLDRFGYGARDGYQR